MADSSFPPRAPTPPPPLSFPPYSTPPPPPPPPTTTTTAVPLLTSSQTPLDRSLRNLQTVLTLLGLFPRSPSHLPLHPLLLPSISFLLLGLALTTVSACLSRCEGREASDGCENYRVEGFEICMLVSYTAVAAVSLACVSRGLGKYGLRRFLFADQRYGRADSRFQKEYQAKINGFFRMVTWWIIPCFLTKLTHDIYFFMHLMNTSIWRSVIIFTTSIISWTYLTLIILSSCTLFHLVCHLQVIHFEDYGKLLEQDLDPMIYVEEHCKLRYNLSKISHRFRMFLLLHFSIVTACLFVIIFQTTAYSGTVNFTNGGNIAVCCVVQVVGLVICLHGAAKISHRAQGISALASRWHALVTCSSSSTHDSSTALHSRGPSSNNLVSFPANLMMGDFYESDLESLDNSSSGQGGGYFGSNAQLASYMSSYHKREALVLYLLSNPGGITLYGWIIDRVFLNTMLMLELTLILFVLGKTIVIPNQSLVTSIYNLL
ncbi:hypothetical protein LUZ60_015646 [Juncus effusus]|nr:hypothetical protein LUZ60_015646 [Juncus effusus]